MGTKEIIDAIQVLLANPIVVGVVVVIVVIVLIVFGFLVKGAIQGYEVTFFPPKIGAKPIGDTHSSEPKSVNNVGVALDLTRVKESNGALWTTVSGCEIYVVNGRIEDYSGKEGVTIALPTNEYFDDRCTVDTRSALGAFVNRVFDGQSASFLSLIKDECRKKLGAGVVQQKTEDESAESFGAGRCVLLVKPLDRSISVALVSTTTQRAGQGLAARISYLFDGMRELASRLADARLNEVTMPILGAGHGGIAPPLALVGLLLAVAEAARYGQGGQRLKKLTIVVFKRDTESLAEVDQDFIRRALALIGSGG